VPAGLSCDTQLTDLHRPLNRAWLAALFTAISALTQLSGDDGQDTAQLAEVASHEPALRALELVAGKLEDNALMLSVQYCRERFDGVLMDRRRSSWLD
jgi:hypothetical protein